jgi:AGCS family alanine or glycine:cation symporter
MIGCLALFQVNQLADLIYNDYQFSKLIVGILCMLIVGVVILGGIVRVGKVTARLVPTMLAIYLIDALYIILSRP